MIFGFQTGLASEAKIARTVSKLVACSAAVPARAREQSAELIARGADCLVSFGIAGGLDPALKTGDLVIATGVRLAGQHWQASPGLFPQLAGLGRAGDVLSSPTIAATPAEKARLWQNTGCVAVDQESDAVAAAATNAGIPFLVLRAICDTAQMTLPPAALLPLRPNGTPDFRRLLPHIARHPREIPSLMTLGTTNAAAHTALQRLASRLQAL
jgi:adenosylhomocysteine nucleosidase